MSSSLLQADNAATITNMVTLALRDMMQIIEAGCARVNHLLLFILADPIDVETMV